MLQGTYIGLAHYLRNFMSDHRIKLIYEGEISQSTVLIFSDMSTTSYDFIIKDSKKQRTIFHCMVELLQNIARHSSDDEGKVVGRGGRGLFILGEKEDKVVIVTANKVRKEDAIMVSKLIQNINGLDNSLLNKIHSVRLREAELSSRGGAGLGFIDMRRKTGNPLDFKTFPVSEHTDFLILEVRIDKN